MTDLALRREQGDNDRRDLIRGANEGIEDVGLFTRVEGGR